MDDRLALGYIQAQGGGVYPINNISFLVGLIPPGGAAQLLQQCRYDTLHSWDTFLKDLVYALNQKLIFDAMSPNLLYMNLGTKE